MSIGNGKRQAFLAGDALPESNASEGNTLIDQIGNRAAAKLCRLVRNAQRTKAVVRVLQNLGALAPESERLVKLFQRSYSLHKFHRKQSHLSFEMYAEALNQSITGNVFEFLMTGEGSSFLKSKLHWRRQRVGDEVSFQRAHRDAASKFVERIPHIKRAHIPVSVVFYLCKTAREKTIDAINDKEFGLPKRMNRAAGKLKKVENKNSAFKTRKTSQNKRRPNLVPKKIKRQRKLQRDQRVYPIIGGIQRVGRYGVQPQITAGKKVPTVPAVDHIEPKTRSELAAANGVPVLLPMPEHESGSLIHFPNAVQEDPFDMVSYPFPSGPITPEQFAALDALLANHPAINDDLKEHPSWLHHKTYIASHPDLQAFLKEHSVFQREIRDARNHLLHRPSSRKPVPARVDETEVPPNSFRISRPVADVLNRLDPLSRAAFIWCDVDRRTHAQALSCFAGSTELGIHQISEKQLKSFLRRARRSVLPVLKKLDPAAFFERGLNEPFRYLILDGWGENIPCRDSAGSYAVVLAFGIDRRGHRASLLADVVTEGPNKWRDVLMELKEAGLHGVELVLSQNDTTLMTALDEFLPKASWQRCTDDWVQAALHGAETPSAGCLQELRAVHQQKDHLGARRCFSRWMDAWSSAYPCFSRALSTTFRHTLLAYALPEAMALRLKSMRASLRAFHDEVSRRRPATWITVNQCFHLIRTIGLEMHLEWQYGRPFLHSPYKEPDV